MKHRDLISEKLQSRLYLIHHMHHYQRKNEVIHELHHCFLFSKPNMKGEKFSVKHLFLKDKLYHVLEGKVPEILFDHANNSFTIKRKEINHQTYFVI